MNRAIGSLLGLDQGPPTGASSAIMEFSNVDPQAAFGMAMQQYQASLPKAPEITDSLYQNFTPESVARFAKTGSHDDLIPRDKAEEAYRIAAAKNRAKGPALPKTTDVQKRQEEVSTLLKTGALKDADEAAQYIIGGYAAVKDFRGSGAEPSEYDAELARQRAKNQAREELAAPQKDAAIDSAMTYLDRLDSLNSEGVGGPLAGLGNAVTFGAANKLNPSGADFENAVAGLNDEILRLTRIPGVGTQSNLEALKAELAGIQYGAPEATTRFKLQTIRQKLETIRAGSRQLRKLGEPVADPESNDPLGVL